MVLNTSIQQFVERFNDLNRYLLYFHEENPKQLDYDKIIDILDQAKAWDPEWHEEMVNANIDICEMSYEESVSYFQLSGELGENQAYQRCKSCFITSRL
jgi:hypothetical protein